MSFQSVQEHCTSPKDYNDQTTHFALQILCVLVIMIFSSSFFNKVKKNLLNAVIQIWFVHQAEKVKEIFTVLFLEKQHGQKHYENKNKHAHIPWRT